MAKITLAGLLVLCCGTLFAAQTFDSNLKLKVYLRGSGDMADKVLGFTPVQGGHRIRIEPDSLWYIRPVGPLPPSIVKQLVHLANIEKIPGLDLSDHWDLSDETLSLLSSIRHLVLLDISRTRISDRGLSTLKSLTKMKVLILPEAVTDIGLSQLQAMVDLRELNIDQTHITDKGLEVLQYFARLENLDLSSTRVTDAGLASLVHMSFLRRLVLGGLITDASAPSLRKLSALREIDVSQSQIGPEGLEALASLPHLKTIFLGKGGGDKDVKALSKSRSLRAIDLTRTDVTNTGIQSLAEIKTLEEIALSQTSIGNESLPFLAMLPELRMIELSDTRVTSAGLAVLSSSKKLEIVSLSWQTLTREDLRELAKLKQVKTFVLNGVPLSEVTMTQLKRIGTPSPWESINGLERARLRETNSTGALALGAPVQTPRVGASGKAWPELAAPSFNATKTIEPESLKSAREKSAKDEQRSRFSWARQKPKKAISVVELPAAPSPVVPSVTLKPELISARALTAAKPSALTVASLHNNFKGVTALSSPHQSGNTMSDSTVARDQAPVSTTTMETDENLLRVITLQSNPARSGGFSGLAAMRHVRQTDNVASLNTVMPSSKDAVIHDEEDSPKNFLGDLSIPSRHSR